MIFAIFMSVLLFSRTWYFCLPESPNLRAIYPPSLSKSERAWRGLDPSRAPGAAFRYPLTKIGNLVWAWRLGPPPLRLVVVAA